MLPLWESETIEIFPAADVFALDLGTAFREARRSSLLEVSCTLCSSPFAHSSFFSISHWNEIKKSTKKEVRKSVYMRIEPFLFCGIFEIFEDIGLYYQQCIAIFE